jgi:RHS repeat-associated protein
VFRMSQTKTNDSANPSQQRTLLLAVDLKNSVLAEIDAGNTNRIAYSPYGHQSALHEIASQLGFNGERRETIPGWYFLGNGYRVYNPCLMRFHSPDNMSPFGKGGLNAYMYCGGEPIMRSDPTGHAFGLLALFKSRMTRATIAAAPINNSPTSVVSSVANSVSTKAAASTRTTSITTGAATTSEKSAVNTLNKNMEAIWSNAKAHITTTTDTFRSLGANLQSTLNTNYNPLTIANQASAPFASFNLVKERVDQLMINIRGGMTLYVNPPVIRVTPPTPPPPRRPPRSGG